MFECLIGEDANIGEEAMLSGVIVDYGATVPAGHIQTGGTYPQ
jgi:acetyltransferase-like isoleucine patch superfamily enzyme